MCPPWVIHVRLMVSLRQMSGLYGIRVSSTMLRSFKAYHLISENKPCALYRPSLFLLLAPIIAMRVLMAPSVSNFLSNADIDLTSSLSHHRIRDRVLYLHRTTSRRGS